MTFERAFQDHELHRATTGDDGPEPGRRSAVPERAGGAGPVASGLIHRKAERDDNGVAAGAEQAVAAASTSSGFSLPTQIRRSFETSLGADLSAVRIHTGADSAKAASAVGARAYAVGQDIHFNAGQYNPSSSGGLHLLAHEVAHTVQQQGSAPTRQNKLDVSRAHDGAEVEADAAADAMVSGRSFTVSRSPSTIARDRDPNAVVFKDDHINARKPVDNGPASADNLANQANQAESKARDAAKTTGSKSVIGTAASLTVTNRDDAERIIRLIQASEPGINSGITKGDITTNVRDANVDALGTLRNYADTLDHDELQLNQFNGQTQMLGIDFARLRAEILTFDKSGQSGGAVKDATGKNDPGAVRGEKAGGAIMGATGGSAAEMNKGFKETLTAKDGDPRHSTNATTHWANVQRCETELSTATNDVTQAQRDLLPAELSAQAAFAGVRSVLAGRAIDGYTSEINQLTQQALLAEEKVKLVAGTIKNITAGAFALITPTGPQPGAAVAAAQSIVADIIAFAARHMNDTAIEDKAAQAAAEKAKKLFEDTRQAALTAQARLADYANTASKLSGALDRMTKAKTQYRDAMKLMGQSMDKAQGGNAFSVIATLLAEAETYLKQSGVTIEMGKNAIGTGTAKASVAETASLRAPVNGQVTYYLAMLSQDKTTFHSSRGQFTMKGALSAQGVMRNTVEKALALMETERAEVEGMASRLRGAFKP
jgi:hypothetical protein